ncbi:hypothetical protein [uncultured Methanoregula sp.]|nr:hypothetical protein [uncultured Methanoregula sp.]
MITNVSMFSWLIDLIRHNTALIGIVIVLLEVILFFGWYRRRL